VQQNVAPTVAPPSAAAAALLIDGVTKTYRHGRVEIRALVGASLRVGEGEFVAVMGPSGSGKSTLLGVIAGLDVPTSGSVHVRGCCISAMTDDEATAFRRRHIGIVYQRFNLFPDLTIEENVAVPLMLAGRGGDDVTGRVRRALGRVGLDQRRDHLPTEVSGGEVQRAAIARALVSDPAIVLADEPTGNLDSATGEEIMKLFNELWANGQTIVLVTHEHDIAAHARRQIHLRDGIVERDVQTEKIK